jgi:hypothetical protein
LASHNGEAFGFGNRRNDDREFFVARVGVNYKFGTF